MTDLINLQSEPTTESLICRICGEESQQGQLLFHLNKDLHQLAVKICSYISIKLKYARRYPNWICPGCHLQFESTNQFFEIIRKGQNVLVEKFGVEPRKRKKLRRKKIEQHTETIEPTTDVETTEDGRKRSTKTPGRLQDSMQGDELEKLYAQIGVSRKPNKQNKKSKTKLIAHIENQEGATLGEMLAIPRNPQRTSTRYQCDICKERFTMDSSFFKHAATHTNILYECTFCEKSFPSKALFDEHQIAENHEGLGIIEMPPTGDDNTENPATKDKTEPAEEPPPARYVCTKCPKSFLRKTSMKRHQVTHSQNRPFKCDLCPATFKLRSVLSIHKTSHTRERAFKCHKCPKTFIHKQTLKAHLRSHDGLKPYLCWICKNSFSQLGALQEHKRTHTGERPYVCLICATAFRTSSQCRLHQKVHTNPKGHLQRPIEIEYENINKTHKCKACGKLFSHRSSMIKHLRTHTGEKPYACHLCPKRFSDPSNFKKHKRIHTMQSGKRKTKAASLLKQSLTEVSSNSDPDPDGLQPADTLPSENIIQQNRSVVDIFDEDNDRHSKSWGLLHESSDPTITEIHTEESLLVQQQQQQLQANQWVCISYQDPLNPVSSKTTFYVVN